MTIDGEFNICGSVKVHDGSDISGDAYIGLDRHQIHSVHGDFTVFGQGHAMKVFKGASIAKEMHADGSLTDQGVTSLLDNTVVNTTAMVNGKLLFGSRLRVDEDSTFSMNTNIDGSTEVLSTMTVMKNATVNGDAVLG